MIIMACSTATMSKITLALFQKSFLDVSQNVTGELPFSPKPYPSEKYMAAKFVGMLTIAKNSIISFQMPIPLAPSAFCRRL